MEGTKATLKDGKEVRVKAEDYGIEPVEGNMENFITAVRNDDPSMLNAPIEVGAISAILCNLGNIGTRLGNASLGYDGISQRITQCSADLTEANAMLTKEYRWPHTLV